MQKLKPAMDPLGKPAKENGVITAIADARCASCQGKFPPGGPIKLFGISLKFCSPECTAAFRARRDGRYRKVITSNELTSLVRRVLLTPARELEEIIDERIDHLAVIGTDAVLMRLRSATIGIAFDNRALQACEGQNRQIYYPPAWRKLHIALVIDRYRTLPDFEAITMTMVEGMDLVQPRPMVLAVRFFVEPYHITLADLGLV